MILFRRLAILLGLFLLLLTLALNANIEGPVVEWVYTTPYMDKVMHFFFFGLLSMLVSLGFSNRRARILFVRPLYSSLALALFATLEELSQRFIPTRSYDLNDLAFGLLGIFLLGELGALLRRRIHRRRSGPNSGP